MKREFSLPRHMPRKSATTRSSSFGSMTPRILRQRPATPANSSKKKGRRADGHVGRSRHDRDDGGRRRDQDADNFTHTDHSAAKPKRPVAHFHSTDAAPDGRRGGRAHEKG